MGTGFFLLASGFIVYLWGPLLTEVVAYQWRQWHPAPVPPPEEKAATALPENLPDPEFSLLIPKLEVVAKVFPQIDPGRPEVYLSVLKEGVAHAAGSAFPGEGKLIFLFAHSTNAPWNVVRYNAVFFLLNKLEVGEEVQVVYQRRLYRYRVKEKKIVTARDTSFFTKKYGQETLILQTCWPPGTLWKRLLVFAQPF